MLLVLDEMVALADELPLANEFNRNVANAAKPAETSDGTVRNESWWKVILDRVTVEARGLLRVSRIDSPEAALLAPEQGFFLRENLKFKLLKILQEILLQVKKFLLIEKMLLQNVMVGNLGWGT
jgi:uroporphyrin-3 C-methyltransferase